MTDSRDRNDPRDRSGRSRFAQGVQAHEERAPEDESAPPLPSEAGQLEGYYGSGGSYGYGGGFEHEGEPGYEEPPPGRHVLGDEEFYESTGGFGHDMTDREGGVREGGGRAPRSRPSLPRP
jgi:hypothetical protein